MEWKEHFHCKIFFENEPKGVLLVVIPENVKTSGVFLASEISG